VAESADAFLQSRITVNRARPRITGGGDYGSKGLDEARPRLTTTQHMKIKLIMTAAAVAMLAGAAIAADDGTATTTTTTSSSSSTETWWHQRMTYEKYDEQKPLFRANELTLDLFGTYLAPERGITHVFQTRITEGGSWGGGVGANYFWSKDVGIGVDTSMQHGAVKFFDHVGGNLFVRIPIDVAHIAPYVFAGGGYRFDQRNAWFGDLGTGLDFRFNHFFGLFGDVRYIFGDKPIAQIGGGHDQLLIRSGIRIGF
jgi:hypothetical protein